MFLSSAPKMTYYTFKKIPIRPKIMQLVLANNVSLKLYYIIKIIFQPRTALSLFNWLPYQSILPYMWLLY